MHFLFSGIAQDSLILYSFCRTIDQVIDSEISKRAKLEFLKVTEKFLNEVYHNYRKDSDLLWHLKTRDSYNANIRLHWKYFESKLNNEQLSAFRNFSRIAWYLPRKLFDDLIKGFQWDIEGIPIKDENDFINYATLVSKSTFTLWVILVYHKNGEWPDNFGPLSTYFVEHLGNLGLVCSNSKSIQTSLLIRP